MRQHLLTLWHRNNKPQQVYTFPCDHFTFDLTMIPSHYEMMATNEPQIYIQYTIRACYVLVDYISSMNNMSYDVLFHSHYIDVYINVTRSTCQVYDSNLIVVGDINFPFIIVLVSLITPLFVINKELNYNLLLGKPLIHCMHIVPSSLYLCIYFLFKEKLVLINSNPLLPHCSVIVKLYSLSYSQSPIYR